MLIRGNTRYMLLQYKLDKRDPVTLCYMLQLHNLSKAGIDFKQFIIEFKPTDLDDRSRLKYTLITDLINTTLQSLFDTMVKYKNNTNYTDLMEVKMKYFEDYIDRLCESLNLEKPTILFQ